MSDTLARLDPVPAEPLAFDGGAMALSPAVRRYSLRGTVADLAACTAVQLPGKIGEVSASDAGIAVMLGPDEWLLIGMVAGNGAGRAVSITEITERQIGLRLDGPGVTDMLMSGCPLDLAKLAPGRGMRTIYETVEIVVIKLGAQSFHVEVWRSFAPWLWAALAQAALDGAAPAR